MKIERKKKFEYQMSHRCDYIQVFRTSGMTCGKKRRVKTHTSIEWQLKLYFFDKIYFQKKIFFSISKAFSDEKLWKWAYFPSY